MRLQASIVASLFFHEVEQDKHFSKVFWCDNSVTSRIPREDWEFELGWYAMTLSRSQLSTTKSLSWALFQTAKSRVTKRLQKGVGQR